MSWSALHNKSEGFALQAEQALKVGNIDSAKQNYSKAAEFEQFIPLINKTRYKTLM